MEAEAKAEPEEAAAVEAEAEAKAEPEETAAVEAEAEAEPEETAAVETEAEAEPEEAAAVETEAEAESEETAAVETEAEAEPEETAAVETEAEAEPEETAAAEEETEAESEETVTAETETDVMPEEKTAPKKPETSMETLTNLVVSTIEKTSGGDAAAAKAKTEDPGTAEEKQTDAQRKMSVFERIQAASARLWGSEPKKVTTPIGIHRKSAESKAVSSAEKEKDPARVSGSEADVRIIAAGEQTAQENTSESRTAGDRRDSRDRKDRINSRDRREQRGSRGRNGQEAAVSQEYSRTVREQAEADELGRTEDLLPEDEVHQKAAAPEEDTIPAETSSAESGENIREQGGRRQNRRKKQNRRRQEILNGSTAPESAEEISYILPEKEAEKGSSKSGEDTGKDSSKKKKEPENSKTEAARTQTDLREKEKTDGNGTSKVRTSRKRGSKMTEGMRQQKTERENAQSRRRFFTTQERNLIYNRSEGHCGICGRFIPLEEYTIDHIIPLSKGGTNDLDNLQACCSFCNKAKDDSMGEDFYTRIERIFLYQARLKYGKKQMKRLKKALKELEED